MIHPVMNTPKMEESRAKFVEALGSPYAKFRKRRTSISSSSTISNMSSSPEIGGYESILLRLDESETGRVYKDFFTLEFIDPDLESHYYDSVFRDFILYSTAIYIFGLLLLSLVSLISLVNYGFLYLITDYFLFTVYLPTVCLLFVNLASLYLCIYICCPCPCERLWKSGQFLFEAYVYFTFFTCAVCLIPFHRPEIRAFSLYTLILTVLMILPPFRFKYALPFSIMNVFAHFASHLVYIVNAQNKHSGFFQTTYFFVYLCSYLITCVSIYFKEATRRDLFYKRYLSKRKERELLERSKLSRILIKNIFPVFFINDIKIWKKQKYFRSFEELIYFTSDFVKFTEFSSKKKSFEVIQFLNATYSQFDLTLEKWSPILERTKTIGDAYCVLADPFGTFSTEEIVLGMILFSLNALVILKLEMEDEITMRIGISCNYGSVVIFGKNRLTFDVIGKVASEGEFLEKTCDEGTVHVNAKVFEILKQVQKKEPNLIFRTSKTDHGFLLSTYESQNSRMEESVLSQYFSRSPIRNRLTGSSSSCCGNSHIQQPSTSRSSIKTSSSSKNNSNNNNIGQEEEVKKEIDSITREERLKWSSVFFQCFCNCQRQTEFESFFGFSNSVMSASTTLYIAFIQLFISLASLLFFTHLSAWKQILVTLLGVLVAIFQIFIFLPIYSCRYRYQSCCMLVHIAFFLHLFVCAIYWIGICCIDFEFFLYFRALPFSTIGFLLFFVPTANGYLGISTSAIFTLSTLYFIKFMYADHLVEYLTPELISETNTDPFIMLALSFVFFFVSFFRKVRLMKVFAQNRIVERRIELVEEQDETNDMLIGSVLPKDVLRKLLKGCRGDDLDWSLHSESESCVGFFIIDGISKDFEKFEGSEQRKAVSFANELFSYIDSITEFFSVEKVKVISDIFLFCTLDNNNKNNNNNKINTNILLFSIFLMQQIARNEKMSSRGKKYKFKIGLNSGVITSGIVGRSKFLWDIFGDTVNVSSRMATTASGNSIRVSEGFVSGLNFFEDNLEENNNNNNNNIVDGKLRRDDFQNVGSVSVKGKGEMNVYEVLWKNIQNDEGIMRYLEGLESGFDVSKIPKLYLSGEI